MPEISIILPTYNVGSYLNVCVDSILNQTFDNFEIIIVNDGSTDNTLSIAKKLEKKDGRIKVISQKNLGAGAARNRGLIESKGTYVMFLDPDDVIPSKTVEKLYIALIGTKSEIAISDFSVIYQEKENYKRIDIPANVGLCVSEQPSILVKINPQPWNKLFKKELLINNKIFFPTKHRREDLVVVYSAFLMAKSIVRVNDSLYKYTALREGSATKANNSTLTDVLKNLNVLNDFCDVNLFTTYFPHEIDLINLKCALGWYKLVLTQLRGVQLKENVKIYNEFLIGYFDNIDKNKYFLDEFSFSDRMVIRLLKRTYGPMSLSVYFKLKQTLKVLLKR